MQLKQVIQDPCGIRYMVDALDVQSGVAGRLLLEQEMMTCPEDITREYAILRGYTSAIQNATNQSHLKTLLFRLQGLKDLRTTLHNLSEGHLLDDIELFEIKHLSLLAEEVRKEMTCIGLPVAWESTEPVTQILDPDGLHIGTFYIYDSYSALLTQLRRQLALTPDNPELAEQISQEEDRIRMELSHNLHPYAGKLREVLIEIATVDIRTAKALQIQKLGLCYPTIGNTCQLTAMWHPEVENILSAKGKHYQPTDIHLLPCPTILTGANMGGKTVVMKTVALCQYLLQFGFGIPAAQARMQPFAHVCTCMADGQSIQSGLSSFAAEMQAIHTILTTARTGESVLALIDEPARTTNPVEGTALVSALVEVLKETGCTGLIVTHYNIHAHACPCLRVKGMENGEMNYQLVEAHEGEVPHEAMQIAEQLGIDTEWLKKARMNLQANNN